MAGFAAAAAKPAVTAPSLPPGKDMTTTAQIDFAKAAGTIRPALHSSGWTPRSSSRAIQNDDAAIKSFNMAYARTHDWALANPGQRVIDYQYIFPLIGQDPADPSNYVFAPTDHILQLSRNVGLKTFYRLGTSIEHTGSAHFNAEMPKDFDKVAEIFAGIVRHYNRGWANGKTWDIAYWELWNEPDGITAMWCETGKPCTAEHAAYMRAKYVEFFVTCLKRLKSEFPEIKVGGPALSRLDPEFLRAILVACRKEGVAPDFISWHYYGTDPDKMIYGAEEVRKLCDSYGFKTCELILNEWHYILTWDGIQGHNSSTAMVRRALDGPTGHNNIDSATFTLASLAKFQTSKLDQAYFYGCFHFGNWGYMDEYRQFNKNGYACRLFGEIVKDFPKMCASASSAPTVTTLAVKSADGKKAGLLVVDYRGTDRVLTVDVKGAAKAKYVSAIVLDDTRDNFPCEVGWRNGVLTLGKADRNSAAFFVTFE